MAPTFVSTWNKFRTDEKNGLHGYRAQSEVISANAVRLSRLSTGASPQRMRASSVELRETIRPGDPDTLGNQYELPVLTRSGQARSDSSESRDMQLKIFVGSWNMAAKDPFITGKGATYVGDEVAAQALQDLIPPGYDVYVLGTQEKVSKHLHTAVLARLHASSEQNGRRYFTLRERCQRRRRTRSRGTGDYSPRSDDTNEHSASGNREDRLRASSFALEASASGLRTPTNRQTSTNQDSVIDHSDVDRSSVKEVRGRGDGAFLTPKSTSIAIYCACELEGVVDIVKSGVHKFSWSSGSKGGVAVMLSVGDSRQTITFANCHLEANKPSLRRKQLATLSTKLGEALGGEDLASSSDHVVWMGDFNYRIHTLDGETVLKLLVNGKHLDIHDRYDSMKDDVVAIPSMDKFREPSKWPTFYPTYKKIPGRPHTLDINDPSWVSQVYRVRYKEPFYKGGKVKARVPGWCDRILHCSFRDDNDTKGFQGTLHVEQVDYVDPTSKSTPQRRDNYRAINDGLCGSDHSPVYCTFVWTIPVEGDAAKVSWDS